MHHSRKHSRATCHFHSSTKSARRFSAQQVCSWHSARGFSLPKLIVSMRSCGTPSKTIDCLTASARRWPRARLYSRLPRSSQFPCKVTWSFENAMASFECSETAAVWSDFIANPSKSK